LRSSTILAALDVNFTFTDLNVTDGDITALTVTLHVGVLLEWQHIKGSSAVWMGAVYQNYNQTLSTSIKLREVDPGSPQPLAGTF